MIVHTNADDALLTISGAASATGSVSDTSMRLRYETPKLQRLGSVRDLTLGSTGGAAEIGMRARAAM
jgi:hypothetical protein